MRVRPLVGARRPASLMVDRALLSPDYSLYDGV